MGVRSPCRCIGGLTLHLRGAACAPAHVGTQLQLPGTAALLIYHLPSPLPWQILCIYCPRGRLGEHKSYPFWKLHALLGTY